MNILSQAIAIEMVQNEITNGMMKSIFFRDAMRMNGDDDFEFFWQESNFFDRWYMANGACLTPFKNSFECFYLGNMGKG